MGRFWVPSDREPKKKAENMALTQAEKDRVASIETDVEEMQEQKTDIFKQQESTISLLTDVLEGKLKQPAAGPTYVTQQAPKEEKAAPNYALYIGGAAVLWFLLKGK